jgi:protein-tyrosine kinase
MTKQSSTDDRTAQLGNLVQHFSDGAARVRTLALVSSSRGEGTSTCTANIAKYLACKWDSRVLMVDANLRNPALHELADVDRNGGLAEYLSGSLGLDTVVKKTSIPRLFVITAGAPSEDLNPNRVFETTTVRDRLIPETGSFDFILFDCPPVNLFLEAINVARLCDGVVLVVEGEKTRRQAAQSAQEQLSRANCNILGVFMNKRKFYIPRLLYERI